MSVTSQRLRRALTVDNLMNMAIKSMQFNGKWKASFGEPELKGSWIIWGNSGNGKTRFALQLAKYLCNFSKVLYNSMEEGVGVSFRRAIMETNMSDVANNFHVVDNEPINELKKRLRRQRSEDIVFIDSLQYSMLNYNAYVKLKEEFPNKLFIFISHAEGKNPAGRTANKLRYDANIKIHISQYSAYPVSRYGGGKPYVIWKEGVNDL